MKSGSPLVYVSDIVEAVQNQVWSGSMIGFHSGEDLPSRYERGSRKWEGVKDVCMGVVVVIMAY